MTEDPLKESIPDRPLECSECKKCIAVRYTEITDEGMLQTSLCADCPELQRRLHGMPTQPLSPLIQGKNPAELVCGGCETTFEEIKRGQPLGCPECYSVFEELLLLEMQATNRYPLKGIGSKKNPLVHIGRGRDEKSSINPSSRLLALNEALKETLTREDYEEAALLRDQIKALTEKGKSREK